MSASDVQPVSSAPDAPKRALLENAVLALGSLALTSVLVLRARRYWPFTLDDAYITLRYSKHLAHGLGPSWNPGAEPTEGYTTALWMLLLALPEALGVDGIWFAKASGVVLALGATLSAALVCRQAGRAAGQDSIAGAFGVLSVFALSISYWPLALHAVSGMETTFSCLIFTLFFLFSVRAMIRSEGPEQLRSRYTPLALCALLATLTRPEAGLLCAITLATHLFVANRDAQRVLVRSTLLWFVLPGALYLLLRWLHFGLLFPLSFYVKATDQPLFTGLPDVLGFFRPFVIEQPWWCVLILLGAAQTRALLPALVGGASFAIFFIFPEHIMAFESRYLLPLFPLLAALAGVGSAAVLQRLASARANETLRRGAVVVAVGTLVALSFWTLPGDAIKGAERWLAYGKSLHGAHVALARDLKPAQGQGGRIALLDVGAVGYYADWYTIDTFGLNDAHVALSKRTDVQYVLDKRPDLLVVVSEKSGAYHELFEWETPLYEAARKLGYTPLCEYTFDPEYHLQILSRPDSDAIRGRVCESSSRMLVARAD